MGATGSCHDFHCDDESQAHEGSSPVMIKGIAFDAFHEEEVCSLQPLPELKKADLGVGDNECRLRFQLPPAAPFGLQLAEAKCQSQGGSLSSALVVQHVTACSSLAKTIDGQPGVYAGDVIIEANGRRGTAVEVRDALQQAVASSGTRDINLVVCRRPCVFDVEIPWEAFSQQKLGIAAVIDKAHPGCVLVQSVRSEGVVPTWNAAHASLQICAGDLITEVNSISNDASAMCLEMQSNPKGTALHFRVAARKMSGKAHQAPDPRLLAPRSLIEAVGIEPSNTKRTHALVSRRCADTERWQAELEAKSQRLRREVEMQFELSSIASEPCFRHIVSLDDMAARKRIDTSSCDDDQMSEVSTMCPTVSSTPIEKSGSFDFL